jgi:hypothetical protein
MTISKTHREFVNIVYERVKCDYSVLTLYKNARIKVKMKHNSCGFIFDISPHHFLYSSSRCPNCFKNHRITTSKVKKEIQELTNGEYSLEGEYKNARNKVKIKHLSPDCDNNIFEMLRNNFLKGQRCPICSAKMGGEKQAKSHKEFEKQVYEIYNNEYSVLGEYKTMLTPVKVRHNECGNIWSPRPGDFLQGKKCPKCRESKGEKIINDILSKFNVAFLRQYRNEDCRSQRKLPFDFAVFKDNIIVLMIEYDGELHFKPFRKVKDSIEKFEKTKKHDQIKNSYCKENDIPLLRIPYWEFDNIEAILTQELNKYKLIQ